MAVEIHIFRDGEEPVRSYRTKTMFDMLNRLSDEGCDAFAIIAVGQDQQTAYDRITAYTGEPAYKCIDDAYQGIDHTHNIRKEE